MLEGREKETLAPNKVRGNTELSPVGTGKFSKMSAFIL